MSRHIHVTFALVLGLAGVVFATPAAAQSSPTSTGEGGSEPTESGQATDGSESDSESAPPSSTEEPSRDEAAEHTEQTAEALPTPALLTTSAPEDADPVDEEGEGVLLAFEPGEGVLISTPDHRFEMNIRTRGMLLFTVDVPEPDATGNRADPHLDLDVRRARISIQGRLFDPHVRYRLQLAIAPRDMLETTYAEAGNSGSFAVAGAPRRSPLLDWYLELQHLRELHVRVGQFIVPFNRHRVTSSSSLQLVDRSLSSGEFHLDRDLGIQAYSPDVGGLGWLRYYAGVFMNEGRDGLFGGDLGLLYVGRVEVLPLGLFNDYSEGDLDRSSTPRLSVGVGYAFAHRSHLTQSTVGQPISDGGTIDSHNAEVDAVFLWQGLSLLSEVQLREGWHHAGDPTVTPDATMRARRGVGWFGQAGFLLPDVPVEIAARYGFTLPTGPRGESPVAARSELGAGVNVYFHRHALKLQLDVFHLWDDAPGANGAAFERGEQRVRVMLQASL
jgi:phosphate-selective porin OprO/OprP